MEDNVSDKSDRTGQDRTGRKNEGSKAGIGEIDSNQSPYSNG